MRIVFMGSPPIALPSLQALVEGGHDVCLVVTQPPRATGRGRREVQPPVAAEAVRLGIPVFQPIRVRTPESLDRLRDAQPDAIVVAAYGQILPGALLTIPPRGCINVHPSLLPRHRGASPIAGALLAGDDVTGVSIMLMDEGMDTGPVLSQTTTPIDSADDQVSLTARLGELGASLLVTTLDQWFEGSVSPTPQDSSHATTTRLAQRSDGALDWRQPAVSLWRRVRAFAEWPQSYTVWGDKLLRIRSARVDEEASAEPGRVVPWGPSTRVPVAAAIGTGQGVLLPQVLGLEGRQLLPIDAFLRGQQRFLGSLLTSPSTPETPFLRS